MHERALRRVALDLAGERELRRSPSTWSVISVLAPLSPARMCCSSRAGTVTDDRVGAEAVDDGGHVALAAEAAGGPRARSRCAGSAVEGGVGHGEARTFVRRARTAGRLAGTRDETPAGVYGSDVVAAEELADASGPRRRRRSPRRASGAIESTCRLSKRLSSGIGSVLVTTTSRTGAFFSRSTAGPESSPWVAAISTSVGAPVDAAGRPRSRPCPRCRSCRRRSRTCGRRSHRRPRSRPRRCACPSGGACR